MQLIWFRQDLRLHDHTALWHATQAGETIAIVYLSPKQWQLHNDAPTKIDFYLKHLQQLKADLDQLNIPLIIEVVPFWRDIPKHLSTLVQQLQIKCVYAHREAGVNEIHRDDQVCETLQTQGIGFELYDDRTLFPLGSIRNKASLPYQVFGAFKKYCYEQLRIALPSCWDTPKAQAQPTIPTALQNKHVPSVLDFFPNYHLKANEIPIGESYAHQQLNSFVEDQVFYYKMERDFPALDGTSMLSSYLNIGVLSIRQCIQTLFAEHGYLHFKAEGQQTWFDELLWREFYQHILFDFPQVSKHQPFKENTNKLLWRHAPDDLVAWQNGQTGVPIVDAGMRQLLATGWMHNRVRMIVAMFLSKNLLIDWRLGEQWFMQHLIDGDLAANNGGWQWCASTGTDSVPYFRVFNPISQSQKFDADGGYIRRWVPELAHLDAKSIHEPYAENPNLKLDYPRPIVDLKQSRIRAIEAFKNI